MSAQTNAAVLIDGSRTIISVANPELFGYALGELEGEKIEILVPAKLKEWHEDQVDAWLEDFRAMKHLGGIRAVHFRHKSGEEKAAKISILRAVDNQKIGIAWVSAADG